MMNGFSTGRDIKIDIIDSNTSVILQSFSLLTSFTAKQSTNQRKIQGLDGIVRILELPNGWDGTLDYTRQNNNIDAYIASLETAYYSGLNTNTAQITNTITNPDQSVSIYRFIGATFKLSDSGTWKGDTEVTQKLDWCASLRIPVQ